MITLFVFVMMLIIDYVNVLTEGRMEKAVQGGKGSQYAPLALFWERPLVAWEPL